MKANKKVCGRCAESLPFSDYNYQSNTKDKKGSYCKKCKCQYQKDRRGVMKAKNTAIYLLKESCRAAFDRGRTTYKQKGYEHVSCSFDNANSLRKALWDDEIFRLEWIAQTDVYVANNSLYKYRPTLDRIDPERGYEKDNIRMLPQYINVSKGYSKRVI